MPHGAFFDSFETVGGYKTGVCLAGELINHLPDAVFVALTNSRDADDQAWFEAHEGFEFCWKGDTPATKFAKYLRRILMKQKPRVFIVHGQDHQALLDLKNYLQNVLKFDEPVILHEQASKGMTIIEKFEHYAEDADIVFALLTPDDVVDAAKGTGRARQNVLFEYGFFLGRLGRRSGKAFLLYKKGVEIPSDLAGVIYVEITNGISCEGEQLRRELEELLE